MQKLFTDIMLYIQKNKDFIMANQYPGMSKKIMTNGDEVIMVRFKYLGKTYPLKNFTKLFGCDTFASASEKLIEIKKELSIGRDPFNRKGVSLNDHFEARKLRMLNTGEWRQSTITNYDTFYKKHIKPSIGHLKLDKIEYHHFETILENMSANQKSSKNTLARIVKPIFKEAIKHKEIYDNPALELKISRNVIKQRISERSRDNSLDIMIKVYRSACLYRPTKDEEFQTQLREFFKFMIFTGHRMGEVLQITKEDCYLDEKIIVSPAKITKTKEDYIFPIPPESLEYIKSVKTGKIFSRLVYGSMNMVFKRILFGSVRKTHSKKPINGNKRYEYKHTRNNVSSGVKMYNGKTISIHDLRSIMMNIMIRDCKTDPMLADHCLEHKAMGVKEHYIDFSLKDKTKAFKKYWKTLKKASKKYEKKLQIKIAEEKANEEAEANLNKLFS
jgi:integrase